MELNYNIRLEISDCLLYIAKFQISYKKVYPIKKSVSYQLLYLKKRSRELPCNQLPYLKKFHIFI